MPRNENEVKLKDGAKWKVKTTKEGKFETATLDGHEMDRKLVGKDVEVDLSKMQDDAQKSPKCEGVSGEPGDLGPPYKYCLPLRGPGGVIIWYTCYGDGPYTCG